MTPEERAELERLVSPKAASLEEAWGMELPKRHRLADHENCGLDCEIAEYVTNRILRAKRDRLRGALADIATMLPGSVPLPMTDEEYLRSMLRECVRTARAALDGEPQP